VDESYRRDLGEGFVSWYDETKYGAHEVAEQRIAGGAPIVLALPGTVIGPGDHSEIGEQLVAARDGRLRYVASADTGITPIHLEDAAAGIIAALDRGAPGRSYVLAGECIRLGEAVAIAAEVGGRRAPRIRIANGVLRAIAPLGPLVGRPNLRETVDASAGVTYWATSQRAADELGWRAGDAAGAIRATLTEPARTAAD
jgi:dihydroflavonol-4-reductase